MRISNSSKYGAVVIVGILLTSAVTCGAAGEGQSTPSVSTSQIATAASKSEPTVAASDRKLKAYQTLTFGDNTETVEDKLIKIIVGPNAKPSDYYSSSETPVTIGSGAPSQFDSEGEIDSEKERLQNYFGRGKVVQIVSVTGSNDQIGVFCALFENGNRAVPNAGLAFVEVRYKDVAQDALVATFLANYPEAKKATREFFALSDKHPGVSMRYEREYLVDSTSEVETKLSLPTKKFQFLFKELSQLTAKEAQIWTRLAAHEGGGATPEQYFQNVKRALTEAQITITAANANKVGHLPLDSLTYMGWYQSRGPEQQIYGVPELTVKAPAMIGYHIGNYKRSIDDAWEAKKREDKDKADKALKF